MTLRNLETSPRPRPTLWPLVSAKRAVPCKLAPPAADAVAQGALWSFRALVLGAASAVFGAGAGRRTRLPDGRIPLGAESAPTNMKAAQRPQG